MLAKLFVGVLIGLDIPVVPVFCVVSPAILLLLFVLSPLPESELLLVVLVCEFCALAAISVVASMLAFAPSMFALF